jgi:hypothetical protein
VRTWRRLRVRQRWALVGFVVALVAGLVGCGALAIATWTGSWEVDRRLAALAAIFAGGAVWVAIVAGIVAVVAYALASERPSLRIELRMPHSQPDTPVLCFDPEERAYVKLLKFDQLTVRIRLHNTSDFSARNPAVRVETIGLEWRREEAQTLDMDPPPGYPRDGWEAVEPTHPDATAAYQWDGGLNNSIHGPNWFRDLPSLPLYGFAGVAGARHVLHVEAVAEGDRTDRDYVLVVLPPAEWVHGDPERDELMPEDRYRSLRAGHQADKRL